MFQWVTDLETVEGRTTIKYPVYHGRWEHDMQHMVLHYHVKGWHLESLKVRAQLLDIRCQKCNDLHSNYPQSELKMCVSCTLWLPKPSHQVLGPLCWYQMQAGDKCSFQSLQKHRILQAFGHQCITCGTGTSLKRWHCATPVSSFVQHTTVTISLYGALLKEVVITFTLLTVHIVALYDQILSALQT